MAVVLGRIDMSSMAVAVDLGTIMCPPWQWQCGRLDDVGSSMAVVDDDGGNFSASHSMVVL